MWVIDFTGVKSVIIPEGIVQRITANGNQIWEKPKAYTNLIPTALTEIGGTEIYGGVGYKDGYRWSTSGNKETAYMMNNGRSGRLTGWIPFTYGGVYRVKDFYDLDRNSLGGYYSGLYFVYRYKTGIIGSISIPYSISNGGSYSNDLNLFTIDTSKFSKLGVNTTHFRISGFVDGDNPIITVNEEIPV